MHVFAGIAGLALVLVILGDAFETIILPRRVARRLRITRLYYRTVWQPWAAVARRVRAARRREIILGYFGPLSMLFLMTFWALAMVLGFAVIQWALGSALRAPGRAPDFWTDLYMSGTTFFTLGLGDVTPHSAAARAITVWEAGAGFGFLAIVIGYLPVLYQAFSRREVNVSQLDARAGSPSSATELLLRYAGEMSRLDVLLHDWERWAAELLESHISYPVLGYFRSQHDNQSWLAAMTTVLDASALVIAGLANGPRWQAQLTFAMARHAIVDLAQIYGTPPRNSIDRLPDSQLSAVRRALTGAGLLLSGKQMEDSLARLRGMYEPYVSALSDHLLMPLPGWMPPERARHNWETTAWGGASSRQAAASKEDGDPH